MTSPHIVFWEAVLDNGRVQRETEGVRYADIDRMHMKSFRLISAGTIVAEVFASHGRKGSVLCYRRRTSITHGGTRKTVFILGFVPLGPVYVVDPENEEVLSFDQWGQDGWYMPEPIPEEHEHFTFMSKGHTIDGIVGVAPSR